MMSVLSRFADGAIAVVRQSFFDAQHYALDQADWQKNPPAGNVPS